MEMNLRLLDQHAVDSWNGSDHLEQEVDKGVRAETFSQKVNVANYSFGDRLWRIEVEQCLLLKPTSVIRLIRLETLLHRKARVSQGRYAVLSSCVPKPVAPEMSSKEVRP